MSGLLAPVEFRTHDPSAFTASARVWPVGASAVARVACTTVELRRTARMIRRSDPEVYQLTLALRGRGGVQQARQQATLGAEQLVAYDSSRPFDGWSVAGERPAVGILVVLPRTVLPLPPARVQQLAATRLPGSTVAGQLLIQFLTTLSRTLDRSTGAEPARLGQALVDLLAAYFAGLLDARNALPPESREAALLLAIDDFITRRLRDPALTPATVAAAHHISVRHLHKLYAGWAAGQTVAATIRRRRLEQCHRELIDPCSRHRPVHQIAASWGFPNESHFSRLFKATYGLSPSGLRALSSELACADRQPLGTHGHGWRALPPEG